MFDHKIGRAIEIFSILVIVQTHIAICSNVTLLKMRPNLFQIQEDVILTPKNIYRCQLHSPC
jgi:hypothetical protein